jgi:amphi-Trp domain-containing protein
MPREAAGRGEIVAKPLAVRQSRTANAKAVAAVPAAPEATVAQPAQREPHVTAAIPAKFHGRARRDAAAFYLTQLAKGVLAGELALAVGEQQIQLATSEFVILKIEAKQRKRANHVSVKLRWPRRPLIRIAAARGERDGR